MGKKVAGDDATTQIFSATGLGELLEQLSIVSGTSKTRREWLGPTPSADLCAYQELLGGGRARVGRFTLQPLIATAMADVQRDAERDRLVRARLRTIFCAAAVVAEGQEEAILVSLVGAGLWQTSKVYRAPFDAPELRAIDGSLTSWLYGELQEGPAPAFEGDEARPRDATRKRFLQLVRSAKLAPEVDPRTLWKRCDWLVDVFFELGAKERPELLAQAAPFSAYLREKDQIAHWPHLACYWLCAHYFCGNDEELDETMELAARHTHPAVVELRQVRALLRERPTAVFGRWGGEELAAQRNAVVEEAPSRLLGPGAKARRRA